MWVSGCGYFFLFLKVQLRILIFPIKHLKHYLRQKGLQTRLFLGHWANETLPDSQARVQPHSYSHPVPQLLTYSVVKGKGNFKNKKQCVDVHTAVD